MLSDIYKHERDGKLKFDKQYHCYSIGKTKYISVTKIVKSMFEPFDSNKIIDNMMNSENWTSSQYFGMTKSEILDKWELNSKEASTKGTYMHDLIEKFYNNIEIKPESTNIEEWEMFKNFHKDHIHLKPFRTEWQIYDDNYDVAGTIDMVFLNEDGTVDIYDWKRSAEINKINKYKKYCMCDKFKNIPDSNYYHYSFQLNIYKYILENNYGLKVSNMYLVQIHPDNMVYKKITVDELKDIYNVFIYYEQNAKKSFKKFKKNIQTFEQKKKVDQI